MNCYDAEDLMQCQTRAYNLARKYYTAQLTIIYSIGMIVMMYIYIDQVFWAIMLIPILLNIPMLIAAGRALKEAGLH